MKKLLIFVLCIIALVVTWKQYRHFYQVGNTTLTVWKKWGGYCYITPYKYWGIYAPENNYIKMLNFGHVNIFINKDSTLLILNGPTNNGRKNNIECYLPDYRYLHFYIKKEDRSFSATESWDEKIDSIESLRLPSIHIDVSDMSVEINKSSNTLP